jgi:hypothetical protein
MDCALLSGLRWDPLVDKINNKLFLFLDPRLSVRLGNTAISLVVDAKSSHAAANRTF